MKGLPQPGARVARFARRLTAFPVAGLALCTFGCGPSQPFELVKVAGSVKYDDGSLIPADSITLKFEPQVAAVDSKTHPRKGYCMVNVTDGTFDTATTHKYGDGLVAGRHKVLVVAIANDGRITEVVPDEYRDPATTPVEVDTAESPFEIRVKKPS